MGYRAPLRWFQYSRGESWGWNMAYQTTPYHGVNVSVLSGRVVGVERHYHGVEAPGRHRVQYSRDESWGWNYCP